MKTTFKKWLAVLVAVVLLATPLTVIQLVSAADFVPTYNADKNIDLTETLTVQKSGSYVNYSAPAVWTNGYTVQSTSSEMTSERVAFSNVHIANDGTAYFSATVKSGLICGGVNAQWAGPAIYLGKVVSETKGEGYVTAMLTKEHQMDLRLKDTYNNDLLYLGNHGNYPDSNSAVRGDIDYTITAAVSKTSMSIWVNGKKWVDDYKFESNGLTYDTFEFGIGFVCCQGTVSGVKAWCAKDEYKQPDMTPVYNSEKHTDINSLLQMEVVGSTPTAKKTDGLFGVIGNDMTTCDYVNYGDLSQIIDGTLYYNAIVKEGIAQDNADNNGGAILRIAKAKFGINTGTLGVLFSKSLGIRLVLLDDNNKILAYITDLDYSGTSAKTRPNTDLNITAAIDENAISLYINGVTLLIEHSLEDLGVTMIGHSFGLGFINASGEIANARVYCNTDSYIEPVNISNKGSFVKTEISGGTPSETPVTAADSYVADSDSNDKSVFVTSDISKLINEGATVLTKTVFATRTDYPTDNGVQLVRLGRVNYEGTHYFADLELTKADGIKIRLISFDNTQTSTVIASADYIKADGTKTKVRFDLKDDQTILTAVNKSGIAAYMNGYMAIKAVFDTDFAFAAPISGAGVRNMKTYQTSFIKRYNTGVKAFSVYCFKAEKFSNAPKYNADTDTNLNTYAETETKGGNIGLIYQTKNGGSFKAVSGSTASYSDTAILKNYNIKADGTLYFAATLKGGLEAGGANAAWSGPVLRLANIEKDGVQGALAIRFTSTQQIELYMDGDNTKYFDTKFNYPDTQSANRGNKDYKIVAEVNSEHISFWINGETLIDKYMLTDNGITFKSLCTEIKFVACKGTVDDIFLWCKNEDATAIKMPPVFNPDTDYMLSDTMRSGSTSDFTTSKDANGFDVNIKSEQIAVNFGEKYIKENGTFAFSLTHKAGAESSIAWGGLAIRLGDVVKDGKKGYLELRFTDMASGGISLHATDEGSYDYYIKASNYPDSKSPNRNNNKDYKITGLYSKEGFSLWVDDIIVMDNVALTVPSENFEVTGMDFGLFGVRTKGKMEDIQLWCNKADVEYPEAEPKFNSSIHTNLTPMLKAGLAAGMTATYDSKNGTYDIVAKQPYKQLEFSNLAMRYTGTLYTRAVFKAGIETNIAWAGPELLVANVSKNGVNGYIGIRLNEDGGVSTHASDNASFDGNWVNTFYPDSYSGKRNDNIDYEVVVRSTLNDLSVWVNDMLIIDRMPLKYDDITVTSPFAAIYTANCTATIQDYQVWCENKDVLKTTVNPTVTSSLYIGSGVPAKPEGNINYADRLTDLTFITAGTNYGFYWNEETNTFWNDRGDTYARMEFGNFTDMSSSDTFAMKFKYTVKDYKPNGADQGSMGLRLLFRGFTGYSVAGVHARGIQFAVPGANEYAMWSDNAYLGGNYIDYGFEVGKTYNVEILSGPTQLALWIDGKQIFYYYDLADCEPYFYFEVYRSLLEIADLEIYNIEPETYSNDEEKMAVMVSKEVSKNKEYKLNAILEQKKNNLVAEIVSISSVGVIFDALLLFTVFLLNNNKKKVRETK